MKLFIDTANLEEIRNANNMGVICGVTTNPSLIVKKKKDFKKTIREITKIVDGPISAEVISLEHEKMIEEAMSLIPIHKNIVIKLPMTIEGLKACKILTEKGIKTNVTLIFTATQALVAARDGATYVSQFLGRLDDIGENSTELIKDITTIFEKHNIKTEIIAASVRNPWHAKEAAKAGAHIATVPYNVLLAMTKNELTNKGIERFLKDWENAIK